MCTHPPGPAGVSAAAPRAVPSAISSCRPALANDLAACLLNAGWQHALVVLKQWQCSIDVYSISRRAAAAEEAAGQQQGEAQQLPQQPAVSLKYTSAGAAEVRSRQQPSRRSTCCVALAAFMCGSQEPPAAKHKSLPNHAQCTHVCLLCVPCPCCKTLAAEWTV